MLIMGVSPTPPANSTRPEPVLWSPVNAPCGPSTHTGLPGGELPPRAREVTGVPDRELSRLVVRARGDREGVFLGRDRAVEPDPGELARRERPGLGQAVGLPPRLQH